MLNTRRLIGTPQRGDKGGKGHEFTPIGSRARNGSGGDTTGQNRPLGEINMNRPLFAPINESPGLARRGSLTSSFDNTMDNFNNTVNSFYDTEVSKRVKNDVKVTRVHKEPDFINAAPSIMEQETRVKRLETENYNLKIKVATLQKFLEQTPEEQRDLLSENIGLKQQLVESVEEIRRLQESHDNFASHSDKENNNALDEAHLHIEALKSELKRSDRENEEIINDLKSKCDSLKDKLYRTEFDNPLMDELEHFKEENENLQRMLQNSKSDLDLQRVQQQVEELQQKIDHLQRQRDISEEEKHALDSNITYLKQDLVSKDQQIDSLRSTLDSLEKKLNSSQQENISLMKTIESLKLKIFDNDKQDVLFDDEINRKLQRMESELKEADDEINYWKNKYKSLSENKISSRGELDDLASKLDEYRLKYNRLNNKYQQVEVDIKEQSLKNESYAAKIKLLEREVEEKDSEQFNLRQEINSLLKSQTANDRSEYLEQEVNRLRKKEKELKESISELKQVLDLTDNKLKSSDKSMEVTKLKQQIEENMDRISYYEKEYEDIQRAYQKVDYENSSKDQELVELKNRVSDLENDNELLQAQITSKSNKSAISELEDVNRRKLESEKKLLESENAHLSAEVESLSYDMNILRQELKSAKSKVSTYSDFDPEIDRLRDENRRLQKRIDDLNMRVYSSNYNFNNNHIEGEYEKLMMENNKLQNKIKKYEMDHLNDNLEKQIMIKNLESKLFDLTSDDEKTRLLKSKANEESKVRKLEFDIENMKREQHRELDYYQRRLQSLETANSNSQSKAESSIVSLLEKQLEDSQKLRDDLSKKLAEAMSTNDQISIDLSKASSDKTEYQRRSESLQQHIDELNKLLKQFEDNEKTLKSSLKDSDKKNKDLYDNIMDLNKYNTKLVSKVREMKQRELSVNDLSKKFSKMDIDKKSDIETKLLAEELKYYRAKLYDINMRANDFETLYSFVIHSIKNSDQMIKNDLSKLIESGIYPNYHSIDDGRYSKNADRKLTFKSVALFVLSITKMKRRQEKASNRKTKLYELKTEIESDKLKLLSYM